MGYIIKKNSGQEVTESFDWENAKVEVKHPTEPTLGRIVIASKWDGEITTAKQLLHKVCDAWPDVQRLDCLITPAAFLDIYWVNPSIHVDKPREPAKGVLDRFITKAQEQCDLLLQDVDLRQKLKSHTRYLGIGIDITLCKDENQKLMLINQSSVKKKKKGSKYPPHAEMVAIFDLKDGTYQWTGKSFPRTRQENHLIRCKDLDSHFMGLEIGKTLVLCCHDLVVFSNRGKKNTKADSWRQNIREDFRKKAREKSTEIVLHFYHEAKSSLTWIFEWTELLRISTHIDKYIGNGVFQNKKNNPDRLEIVLDKTKYGNILDFIIYHNQ